MTVSRAYSWKRIVAGKWSEAEYWKKANAPRPDSYMVWADATTFVDIAPRPDAVEEVPILVELKEGQTAAAWAAAVAGLAYLRVPDAYANPPPEFASTRYCTARVKKDFFARLASEPLLGDWIERFEVGLPGANAPPAAPSDTSADAQPGGNDATASGKPPPAAVVGTIDDNLAFVHARFREQGGARTRVEFFWDQASDRELTRDRINACMAAASRSGNIDEELAYRLVGYEGAHRRLGHGTHTMDIAAGERPDRVPDDAPRHVWVQFPARDNWGSSPLGVHVLDGLRYIVDRADALAQRRWADASALPPVVVNLPHANLGGPHDGSSILESAMEELLALRTSPPLDIVLPAGNNHLSRCHAHFGVARHGTRTLEWRVLPDDATPNFLEIWLQDDAAARDVRIHVTPPDGSALPARTGTHAFRRGDVMRLENSAGTVCTMVFLAHAGNGARPMALIAIGPTSTFRRPAGGVPAPCGAWKVGIENTSGTAMQIEAWIQRDDPVMGLPRYGRQSHFEDPRYVRFETPSGRLNEVDDPSDAHLMVRRSGALNGIATGERTVVVGGFRRSDGRPAAYSGRAHEGIRGPDATSVTDESWNRRGILAAGTRSGSVFSMDGTSVAAAQITRLILQHRLFELGGSQPRASVPNASGLSHGRARVQEEADAQEEEPPPEWVPRDLDSTRDGVGRVAMPPLVPPV